MSGAAERPAKLLFVCSRNRRRSLTAEKILEGLSGYEVRSAGTQPEARIVVTEGHISAGPTSFSSWKNRTSNGFG